ASGEGELSRGAAACGTDLEALTRDLRSLAAEIRDLASAALNDGTSDEDVVSGDELSELLRGEAP
ncbi:MAG TPA: hypothetical protein P5117_17025, partial [Spirochaetia bacterium]|nr:hypothetical protein [Spirochaetia bacterium]